MTTPNFNSPLMKRLKIYLYVLLFGFINISAPASALSNTDSRALNYNTVFYNETDEDLVRICSPSTASTTLTGSDNVQKSYNFFVGKGLTPAQSAGIIGNLLLESHLDPTQHQLGGGPGRGIAQWTVTERWLGVIKLAAAQGKSPEDLGVQLDYLWQELTTTESAALKLLKQATNVQEATHNFMVGFERPKAGPTAHEAERIQYAEEVLNKFGGGAPGGASGTATNSTAACSGAGGGVVAGSVVSTALGLAWPTDVGHSGPNSATPAYKAAWNGASDMTDCGAFVSTVMVKSGVDPNYPAVGTGVQMAYVKAHPEKYQILSGISSSAQLQAGDILIVNNGTNGHTLIYVGPQPGGYLAASASLNDHTPQLGSPGSVQYNLALPGIIVARIIK